ncbi:MAG: hypothetical protein AABX33_03895 [Nanoarchaeota archaeon]
MNKAENHIGNSEQKEVSDMCRYWVSFHRGGFENMKNVKEE